jgi:hypothetical protein
MGSERIHVDNPWAKTERIEPDDNLITELINTRAIRQDLSDEEFIAQAGILIISNRVATTLQDALGFNGEEHVAKLFPLMNTINSISEAILKDLIELQKGIIEK